MYMSDGTCTSTRSACRNDGGARMTRLTGIASADPAGQVPATRLPAASPRAFGAATPPGGSAAALGADGVLTRMREGRRVIVACLAALSSTVRALLEGQTGMLERKQGRATRNTLCCSEARTIANS